MSHVPAGWACWVYLVKMSHTFPDIPSFLIMSHLLAYDVCCCRWLRSSFSVISFPALCPSVHPASVGTEGNGIWSCKKPVQPWNASGQPPNSDPSPPLPLTIALVNLVVARIESNCTPARNYSDAYWRNILLCIWNKILYERIPKRFFM